MAPNPLQQQAIDGLLEFINQKEHIFALLEGPAGSGKTYTAAQVVMQAQAAGREVFVATPTHKAKKILVAALAKYGIKVSATTVSALIGKAPSTTDEPDENGDAQWVRAESGGLKPGSLLIVDEISMVGKTDAKAIERVVKMSDSQVIFSGDFAQLRPVKDASIYESMERIPVRFKLNEVMRSGSSGIVGMSKAVRTTGHLDLDQVDNEHVFIYNDAKKFEEAFATTDGAVAIAYTNKRVAELNHIKRKVLYGDHPPKFAFNENLVLTEAPFFLNKRVNGRWENIKVADNNDVLVCRGVIGDTQDGNPFSDDFVTSTKVMLSNPETGLAFEAKALTYDEYVNHLQPVMTEVLKNVRMFAAKLEKAGKQFSQMLGGRLPNESELRIHFAEDEVDWIKANAHKNSKWITTEWDSSRHNSSWSYESNQSECVVYKPVKGSWASVKGLAFARDFFGWRNQFAVLLYEHASTAHKAQGSTYPHTFVDWPNLETIRDMDDRQAACYVAVSRASDTLHIRV